MQQPFQRWQAEEPLRLALTAARMVAWEYDPATGAVAVSDTAAEVFGLPTGTTLDHSDQGFALVHPEDVDGHRAAIGKAAEECGSYVSQFRMIRPADGTVIWLEERGHCLGSASGETERMVGVVMDVSERKQAEEASRQSEQRFRGMFEQTLAGIAETDLTGRFVQVNPRYCEIVGRTAEELYDLRMQDITHPDDLPRNIDLFGGLQLGNGRPFVIEKRYVRPDRSEVWVRNSVSLASDSQGKPKHTVAVSIDITESKRAEATLRESEERYRLVGNAANDAIWDWNLATNQVTWNEGVQRVFGYAAEQVGLDASWWIKHIHPDDRERVAHGIHAAIDSREHWHDEYRYQRSDGSYAAVFDRGRVVRDDAGKPVRMVGSMLDLTERKQAEDQLRASQQRYRTLFDSMDEGYCIIEMIFDEVDSRRAVDYRFVEVNPAFEAQSGLHDAVGRRMLEFVPSIEEHWLANYGDVALTGEPIRFANEYKTLGRWFDAYAFRVGSPDSRRIAVLFTDITDRKQTEQQLRASEEQSRAMAISLNDANRRKDEFLATLAHELRNPLAPLRNGVQLMKLAGDDAATVEQARAMMERQLAQMVRLVDDLLDVSRISRGTLELRKERVDLAAVIESAMETSRPLIEAGGQKLTVDVPPEPIWVDADATRLAQVFANLLNNAAKFSEPGGRITLEVSGEESAARRARNVSDGTAEESGVRSQGSGVGENNGSPTFLTPDSCLPTPNQIVVRIKDEGVGIPREMLSTIFDMFTQVDRSLERSQTGLGIGLTLVKRLVEMHGGGIEAHSDGRGQGSEFRVRLPEAAPAAVRQQKPPTFEGHAPEGSRRCRVLVADDNVDSAASLAALLKMTRNEVHMVHDGEQAVDAAEQFQPDVILLDIGMPKLNGYEACRRIRQAPWGKPMKLIALTGWGQDEDRRKSQEAGFDAHLVKPVDFQALKSLLATAPTEA